jgi:DNA-binding transcriptional regulator YiaG
MGITRRTVTANFEHSKERFSTRKLIPVNPKTVGDHLLLKRIEADLTQPEVAVKAGVSVRKVKAWEYDQSLPTETQWQLLAGILRLDVTFPKS